MVLRYVQLGDLWQYYYTRYCKLLSLLLYTRFQRLIRFSNLYLKCPLLRSAADCSEMSSSTVRRRRHDFRSLIVNKYTHSLFSLAGARLRAHSFII